MEIKKEKFFEKYGITDEQFNETGLNWENLMEIYDDYSRIAHKLEVEAQHIVARFMNIPAAHSVRRRVKEPERVIEKIIRKADKYVKRGISVENYREIITDLIGIRVLHLFKEEWEDIHDEIMSMWELKEKPQVNIREGDGDYEGFEDVVMSKGCEIIKRKHGYRSVHYLIAIKISKNEEILVEIQVRTVFEEAWGEIDHIIRYPYYMDNKILNNYLAIFNRIVGSADEMGSFLQKLKGEISGKKEERE